MATLNVNILNAAHADGLIPKQLSKRERLYLQPSILRANELYQWIQVGQGVDVEQLQARTGLANNTIRQYVRWLMKKRLVYTEPNKQKYLLFTAK